MSKTYYVIAGDFNARHKSWGDDTANPRGRHLHRWLQQYGTENKCSYFAPELPTYEKSYLDHCLADSRLEICTVNNKLPVVNYDSDHDALHLNITLSTQDTNDPGPINAKKLFKKTN